MRQREKNGNQFKDVSDVYIFTHTSIYYRCIKESLTDSAADEYEYPRKDGNEDSLLRA